MTYFLNLYAVGVIILSLGAFSFGLDAGVAMAGRADARETVYHKIGSGIWGGTISMVGGIMTAMADERLHLPFGCKRRKLSFRSTFQVAPGYQTFFNWLFGLSCVGVLCTLVTLGAKTALTVATTDTCQLQDVYQLWHNFKLFCYASIASIILIPTSILLFLLHLYIVLICTNTVRTMKDKLLAIGAFENQNYEAFREPPAAVHIHSPNTASTSGSSSRGLRGMSSIVEEQDVHQVGSSGLGNVVPVEDSFSRSKELATASTSDLPYLVEREVLRQRLGHSASVPHVVASGSSTSVFATPQGSFSVENESVS
ncbi:hypothetical protein RvY_13271 [Ramazzottius varieornatus]|uniref:Uncharacterized protein n=1 Tax=Ramazzottius varieornatus TaxID=947166 RepID=A0A1D1VUU1_RAMVA|nr:hypothetical protein RvY_13271 [Ramazzottius varieornatus]